jgi:membrane protein YdbS with pleckstrin-like domain
LPWAVLAICGPEGSTVRAMTGLREERDLLMKLFWGGLVTALVARFFLSILLYSTAMKVFVTFLLVVILVVITSYVYLHTGPRFAVQKTDMQIRLEALTKCTGKTGCFRGCCDCCDDQD